MKCPCGYEHNTPSDDHCRQCGGPWPPKRKGQAAGEPAVGPGAAVARRHLLVAAGSEPIELAPDAEFTLGRAQECGLTIPSQRVSRTHARLVWRSGFPVVVNQSASNPTLVNERPVEEHELRNRDELQVGPYRLTYRCLRGEETLDALAEEMGQTLVDDDAAMSGSLEVMNLHELLRTSEAQKKTGTIELQRGSEEGQIVLDGGRFESAKAGSKSGEEAVLELLSWAEGSFSFSTEKKAAPMKIIRSFDYQADAGRRPDRLKRTTISDFLAKAPPPPPKPERSAAPAPAAAAAPRPRPRPRPCPRPRPRARPGARPRPRRGARPRRPPPPPQA